MKINLNGQVFLLEYDLILSDLLATQGYDPSRVAVMRNGEIVGRTDFEKLKLNDGDELDVVSFVGGG